MREAKDILFATKVPADLQSAGTFHFKRICIPYPGILSPFISRQFLFLSGQTCLRKQYPAAGQSYG